MKYFTGENFPNYGNVKRWQENIFVKFKVICQGLTHPNLHVKKFAQVWLWQWQQQTHTTFRLCTCDDLNWWLWFTKSHAKDWLAAYFINKLKESSLQFGKVYLSPMFMYATTHQSFSPTKLLNSAICQSFFPAAVLCYTVMFVQIKD